MTDEGRSSSDEVEAGQRVYTPLVLWGWNPGGERTPVHVPHDEFVAKFRQWADAGGPCPA